MLSKREKISIPGLQNFFFEIKKLFLVTKEGLQKALTSVSSMASLVSDCPRHSIVAHGKPMRISMLFTKNIPKCDPIMVISSKREEKMDM